MGATPTAASPPMALKEDKANNESKYDDGNDIVANGSIQAAIAMRNRFNILGVGVHLCRDRESPAPPNLGPSKSCRKTTLEVGLPWRGPARAFLFPFIHNSQIMHAHRRPGSLRLRFAE